MISLLIAILVLLILTIVMLPILLSGRKTGDNAEVLKKIEFIEKELKQIEITVKDEISRNRKELSDVLQSSRQEMVSSITNLTVLNEQKLNAVRDTVENRLKSLQDDNSKRLEQMRATVDEKLHDTLEKRLGEQFKLVSDRLESVHKGLGEMQSLASSVGDLKKVLTNVKTRGTWGEIQLGNLLEQVLSPGQYEANVATKPGSLERVEFAIKLPGKDSQQDYPVWLPIDAKFPQEDYQRLLEAQEQANIELVDKAAKQLEIRIKAEAKDIRDKYIDPPHTTDFGIMFLPTESLYAEVLRRPGLVENLQRDFRVVVTGPMTLAALLNSLQMGFRTLAIEKRASEVWTVLGVIKQEFSKFGEILDRTKKKLEEAGNIIDEASSKSRNIATKLKKVQELPQGQEAIDILDKEES
jgi:DNA recombination protein RmuC